MHIWITTKIGRNFENSQFADWLSISSQFDSNILQLLGIPGRILVPPLTQLFRSNWLHFSVFLFP